MATIEKVNNRAGWSIRTALPFEVSKNRLQCAQAFQHPRSALTYTGILYTSIPIR